MGKRQQLGGVFVPVRLQPRHRRPERRRVDRLAKNFRRTVFTQVGVIAHEFELCLEQRRTGPLERHDGHRCDGGCGVRAVRSATALLAAEHEAQWRDNSAWQVCTRIVASHLASISTLSSAGMGGVKDHRKKRPRVHRGCG